MMMVLGNAPRYYQKSNAINKTIEAIARELASILLVMATECKGKPIPLFKLFGDYGKPVQKNGYYF